MPPSAELAKNPTRLHSLLEATEEAFLALPFLEVNLQLFSPSRQIGFSDDLLLQVFGDVGGPVTMRLARVGSDEVVVWR